jgi:hypothetical protein
MPSFQESRLVFSSDCGDSIQLPRGESIIVCLANGTQPELSELVVALYMNVRRFQPVAREEENRYGPLCRTVGLTEPDSDSFRDARRLAGQIRLDSMTSVSRHG